MWLQRPVFFRTGLGRAFHLHPSDVQGPGHRLRAISWENQLQGLPGLLWKPDPSQRPMDAVRPTRRCDGAQGYRRDPHLRKRGYPLPFTNGRRRLREAEQPARGHTARKQAVHGPRPRIQLSLAPRGAPHHSPSVPHWSPGLATAPRMYFMNERTKESESPVLPTARRSHLLLFFVGAVTLQAESTNPKSQPAVTSGRAEHPGPAAGLERSPSAPRGRDWTAKGRICARPLTA